MASIFNWFKSVGHSPKDKVGLALGGGGARGVAHLGVLKYLDEKGYPVDFIVGTSAGGIFGALYLLSENSVEAYEKMKRAMEEANAAKNLVNSTDDKSSLLANLREKLYLAKTLVSASIMERDPLREFIEELLGGAKTFSDLKKPLYVVASDLHTGEDVVIGSGDLLDPLIATSSIPGVFPPVKYKDFCLVDGGTTQKLPSRITYKLGAAKVLGVDISSTYNRKKEYAWAADVLFRAEEVASNALHRSNRKAVDLLLHPDFHEFKWHEFTRHNEAFTSGYLEALKHARDIDKFYNSRANSRHEEICAEADNFILV
jgi:NTE family protein